MSSTAGATVREALKPSIAAPQGPPIKVLPGDGAFERVKSTGATADAGKAADTRTPETETGAAYHTCAPKRTHVR